MGMSNDNCRAYLLQQGHSSSLHLRLLSWVRRDGRELCFVEEVKDWVSFGTVL
jgi:hypothetical protein